MLTDAMLRNPDSPGFLIDGFPRKLSQGVQFEQEVSTVSMTFHVKSFDVNVYSFHYVQFQVGLPGVALNTNQLMPLSKYLCICFPRLQSATLSCSSNAAKR